LFTSTLKQKSIQPLLAAVFLITALFAQEANQDINNQNTNKSQQTNESVEQTQTPESSPSASKEIKLDEMVITGTKTRKSLLDSPVRTTLISKSRIDAKNAFDFADALGMETGVQARATCQNCGAPEVRLIGLDGGYSAIILNGMPIISPLAAVYFLEQIPANMIDRIEIIKGGASTLYGGSAMAGVINIITRAPDAYGMWVPGARFDMNVQGGAFIEPDGSGTPLYKYDMFGEIVSEEYPVAAYFGGTFFKRGNEEYFYDRDGDGFSEIPNSVNLSLYGSLYAKPSDNDELSISVNRIADYRRGGNRFKNPPHHTDITESAQTERTSLLASWTKVFRNASTLRVYGSGSYTKRDTYYGGGETEGHFTYFDDEEGSMNTEIIVLGTEAYGTTKNPDISLGIDGSLNLGKGNDLITGLQYQYQKVKDYFPRAGVEEKKEFNTVGFFIEDQWDINRFFGFVAGVRFDYHSALEKRIIPLPRGSIKITPHESSVIRLSYSSGYRAPAIFNEEFHICGVGDKNHLTVLADDLKEERSHSVVFSYDFAKDISDKRLEFGISGFYTKIQNAFSDELIEDTVEYSKFEKGNTSG